MERLVAAALRHGLFGAGPKAESSVLCGQPVLSVAVDAVTEGPQRSEGSLLAAVA